MNTFILTKMISMISNRTIKEYLEEENINLKEQDIDFIYNFIHNNAESIISKNTNELLDEARLLLPSDTYNEVEEAIIYLKNKITPDNKSKVRKRIK